MSRFASRVAADAARYRLFARGDAVLVAVSGGPDSTALLAALAELAPSWRLALSAAHINYRLRGKESDADAAFVTRLCKQWGIPLRVTTLDAGPWTGAGRSVQHEARRIRYRALAEAAAAAGARRIALAHTADDQAETLLLWLVRGATLAGMPRARPPGIIRPLLSITRADILRYLGSRRVPFRTDSSNMSSRYLRNRIRHEALPVLRRLNPSIVRALNRHAERLRDDGAYLDARARRHFARLVHRRADGRLALPIAAFAALPIALQRRVVRLLLRTAGDAKEAPPFERVERVIDLARHGRSGAVIELASVRVRREHGALVASVSSEPPAGVEPIPLSLPGAVTWPPTGQQLVLREGSAGRTDGGAIARTVLLDAERLTLPLTVRSWRPGDRLQPAGMRGRKKLHDLFIDRKVPQSLRSTIPIVTAPEGIVWVAGYRAAGPFVATRRTRRVLRLELHEPGRDA